MSKIEKVKSGISVPRALVLVGLLLFVTTLAYGPIVTHQFVNFDDNVYVTENAQVQAGLSWGGLWWAFANLGAGYWHPLTWLSHMADCQFFGLRAWGHHLSSLWLHLGNTVLLFTVLKRMTGACGRSTVVAGLFALHPLHVESVAWVSERKDLLSTVFFLLVLWAYARYVERTEGRKQTAKRACPRPLTLDARLNYGLALFLFALGLMSKPMLITLPLVLLLLDYWPLRRFSTENQDSRIKVSLRLVREKLPFFALAIACSVLTYWGQKRIGALALEAGPAFETRVANAVVSYATYLGKTLWPSHLAVFYPYPESFPVWQIAGTLLLAVGITTTALLWRQQRPYLLVGWLWYVVTLLPVIGVIQVGSHAMADRYTYLPLIGMFVVFAWGLDELLTPRIGHGLMAAGTAVLLMGCLAGTSLQLRHWKDSELLFRHALSVTTGSGKAHNSLGVALLEQGEVVPATAEFGEALRLNPQMVGARNNLGMALLMQGKAAEAIGEFQEVLRFHPDNPEAHNNLGKTLAEQGRLTEAEAQFAEAVRLKPDYAEAHYNLGNTFASAGKTTEAQALYLEALRLKPGFADAHFQLGSLFLLQGNADEAMRHFSVVLQYAPDLAETLARLERAVALAEAAGQTNASTCLRDLLNLYRLNKPFYQPK
jgi:protein O-mannosyl-transferase